ncbi:hypothetical protein BGX34_011284 [Mortierella sp. NVP85]|nr:hypothetical protein BGX34_011284 [Mortierella sp. NVP85]
MSALSTMNLTAVFRISSRLQITVRCTYNSKPARDMTTPSLPHSDQRNQSLSSGTNCSSSSSSSPSPSSSSWGSSEAESGSWTSNPIVQILTGQKKQHLAVATLAYFTLVNGRKDGGMTAKAEAAMDTVMQRLQLQRVAVEVNPTDK